MHFRSMDKENITSASATRRSAIVERIRIREEWSALKGVDPLPPCKPKQCSQKKKEKTKTQPRRTQSDALRGVVALVSVGAESRALPLRAALSALGATVVSHWNALITHLIWAEGGCRSIRAKARLLASHLVSPLWVEACAASAERLPERAFPAAARESDLPSPRTLRRLLKRAEQENIPLVDLLTDSNESDKANGVRFRLRISSDKDTSEETLRDKAKPRDKAKTRDKARPRDKDTTMDTDSSDDDTTRDTSKDTSKEKTTDTSRDTTARTKVVSFANNALSVIEEESYVAQETPEQMYLVLSDVTDVESRVNTAKRRALPISVSPQPVRKSRRKLFTQKEVGDGTSSESDDDANKTETRTPSKMTQRERKMLARAERMAQRIVKGVRAEAKQRERREPIDVVSNVGKCYIVLTGMSRSERHLVCDAIRTLGGRIQTHVNRKTTHVLLGSCRDDCDINRTENAPRSELNASEDRNIRNIEIQREMEDLENIRVGRDITNSIELDDARNTVQNTRKTMGVKLVQNIRNNTEKQIIRDDLANKMGTLNIQSKSPDKSDSNENDVEIVNNNNINEIIEVVTDSNNSDKNKQTNKNNADLSTALSGIARIERFDTTLAQNKTKSIISGVNVLNRSDGTNREVRIPFCDVKKARTLNALLGAARGCRVLYGQWALDSLAENHWIHHQGYEVKHLKKISQIAHVERKALERTHSEYGYDVFNGIRVKLSSDVDQRNAVTELLTLCGGIIVNPNGEHLQNGRRKIDIAQKNRQNCVLTQITGMTQQHIPRNEALTQYTWLSQDGALNKDGGQKQNGGRRSIDYDILLGTSAGEISSKWVFDSVAAGRMRTIRRYINK